MQAAARPDRAERKRRRDEQFAAQEERARLAREAWEAGEPERRRLAEEAAAKAKKEREEAARQRAEWETANPEEAAREKKEREEARIAAAEAARKHQQWLSTPKSQGGGNVMVSRYSWKHPFPGAVRSKKSGGYYDPDQWCG